ncbi:MerR family transcriptional regulator [Campylobacter sp. MIT 99-7217]|uniref:MerR family transcriptional regulator n=1 Tax=Campylobacter sp. MIT 99-7217 TaxID=535091 RepID=UPI00115A7F78|nr:MerR family transcriptional regulator [Campylobacter sp. MIT 99-7217]TQR34511.1 MerR family transcriptional regulator [Campylobacter sp. MIT 99-7217]
MAYTIKEVEKKTGISAHTIRFWAKNGLFPGIERAGAASVRYFSESDLGWVAMVHCLRQSGLSLEAIKEYVYLCLKGDESFEERLNIIKAQRDETFKILESYQKALDKLNAKVAYYEEEIKKRDKKKDAYNPAKKGTIVKDYFQNFQGYERMGENAAKRLAE